MFRDLLLSERCFYTRPVPEMMWRPGTQRHEVICRVTPVSLTVWRGPEERLKGRRGGYAAPEVCFVGRKVVSAGAPHSLRSTSPIRRSALLQDSTGDELISDGKSWHTRLSRTVLYLGMDFSFYHQLWVILKVGSLSFSSTFSVLLFPRSHIWTVFRSLFFRLAQSTIAANVQKHSYLLALCLQPLGGFCKRKKAGVCQPERRRTHSTLFLGSSLTGYWSVSVSFIISRNSTSFSDLPLLIFMVKTKIAGFTSRSDRLKWHWENLVQSETKVGLRPPPPLPTPSHS